MRSRLFYALAIWLLLSCLFGAQYAAIVFSAASLPDVSASPNASITIDGPANTHKNEEVTYTISYNDIPSTGRVEYRKNAGFEIVSVNPQVNTSGDTLIWPHHTIGSSGTITIVGQHTLCDTSVISVTHQATIFDIYPPVPVPSEHSSSVETVVNCNEPPTVSDVRIIPTDQEGEEFVVLSANENITVTYQYSDPDGDPEAQEQSQIRWTRDGLSPSAFDNQRAIPSEETYAEEKWCVTVRPYDGQAYGERSQESCAYIEGIPNDLPQALEVTIKPGNPTVTDTLTVSYVYSDPNGDQQDPSQIEYRWSRDGSFQLTLNDQPTVDLDENAAEFGEEWCVTVRPHDGREHGPESEQACTIINPPGNSLPTAAPAWITPTTPIDNQPLTLTYRYDDRDGDPEEGSQIQWYRNGSLQPAFDGQRSVSADFTNVGEEWVAAIRPKDGEDRQYFGPRIETQPVLISSEFNTPPQARETQIIPAGPGDDDRLRLTYNFVDPEGDPESESTIKWYRNGGYVPEYDGRTVISPDATSVGEEWSAKVTPNDGKDEGDEVEVAAVEILSERENIKPVALDPYLSRGIPGKDENLNLHYEYYDADGDPQGDTQIRWTVDGITNTSYHQLTRIRSKETKVGEQWCATVTPHDGLESGESVRVIRCVKIEEVGRNTKPKARHQIVTPSRPSSKDNLNLEYEYFDEDNDPQSTTIINWKVDGQLVDTFSGLTVIPATQTNPGESWVASVRPYDSYDFGTVVAITPTINVPPELSNVRLMGDPALNQHLTPYYEYYDANGDPFDHVRVRWFKINDTQDEYELQDYEKETIPASDTAGGETWYAVVEAHDGYEYGPEVKSNEVTIDFQNRYYFPFLPYSEDGPKIPRP